MILLDVPSALAGMGPNAHVVAMVRPVDAMTGMIHAGFMCSPKWLIFYLGLITALGKHKTCSAEQMSMCKASKHTICRLVSNECILSSAMTPT